MNLLESLTQVISQIFPGGKLIIELDSNQQYMCYIQIFKSGHIFNEPGIFVQKICCSSDLSLEQSLFNLIEKFFLLDSPELNSNPNFNLIKNFLHLRK